MINYSVDSDGIATIEWDLPGRSQNVLNEQTMAAFAKAAQKAQTLAEKRARQRDPEATVGLTKSPRQFKTLPIK